LQFVDVHLYIEVMFGGIGMSCTVSDMFTW